MTIGPDEYRLEGISQTQLGLVPVGGGEKLVMKAHPADHQESLSVPTVRLDVVGSCPIKPSRIGYGVKGKTCT